MLDKQRKLRFHKRIATLLFLVMLFLYVGMIIIENKYVDIQWVGYIKAFSEAAMVGALADWFAVTALFHYPLGIKIPHTNLIENRKKDIGKNLGDFVVTNFLNPKNIRPYIYQIQISKSIIQWLLREKNKEFLVLFLKEKILEYLQNSDDQKITLFFSEKVQKLSEKLPLNQIFSEGILYLLKNKEHDKILEYILEKIKIYLTDNENIIKDKVSFSLMPDFINTILAQKITEGLQSFVQEIKENPQHSIRQDIEKQLLSFSQELNSSNKWEDSLQQLRKNLFSEERIEKFSDDIWQYVKNKSINDLQTSNSVIGNYIAKNIEKIILYLQNNQQEQQKIDASLQKTIYQFILRNKFEVGNLINKTIGEWEGRTLSEKLELEVGKDLQYIRINGTLVGGLVGLIIYIFTKMFL